MNTPYPALITNKATGEKLTVEVNEDTATQIILSIKGDDGYGRTFHKDFWTIEPTVSVPTGLGAVVEGSKGTRWVLADPEDDGELGEWCSRVDGGVEWAHNSSISKFLRDGGRVLSEGVK